MIDWLALVAVWGFVIRGIWRGYRHERQVDRYALLTWTIFIALGWLMTVRVPAIERAINNQFDEQPVAYLLNAAATLTAAGCYATSLLMFPKEDMPLRQFHRWLAYSIPGAGMIVSAILVGRFESGIEREQTYYLMRWVMALEILVVIGGMFMPLNWWMAKHEAVMPMRVKHLAMVAVAVYASGTVVTLVLVPLNFLTRSVPPDILVTLRLVLGMLCILIILSPHRWIVAASAPLKWHRYRRIAALERTITQRTSAPRERFDWRRVFVVQYVEFATYLALINILDHYRLVAPDDLIGQALRHQIETLWQQNPDYDDLVKALSEVSA